MLDEMRMYFYTRVVQDTLWKFDYHTNRLDCRLLGTSEPSACVLDDYINLMISIYTICKTTSRDDYSLSRKHYTCHHVSMNDLNTKMKSSMLAYTYMHIIICVCKHCT